MFNQESLQKKTQDFGTNGSAELGNLIIGEEPAKRALLVSALLRQNVLLSGHPGGGKSELSGNFYRLVKDVSPAEVAMVPSDAELSSSRLVGGQMSSTKKITRNGYTDVETSTVDIDALIDEKTVFILADEITRVNPYALNQLLRAFENGELSTTAGIVKLIKFVMAISTKNPSENSQGTFALSAAQASRHSRGAILGFNTDEKRREIVDDIVYLNWKPTPERMKPVVNLEELILLGDWVMNGITISRSHADRLVDLIILSNDTLCEHGIEEADGRMASQITAGAKGYSGIDGEAAVTEKSINESVISTVVARLAALKRKNSKEIYEIADSIVNK
jgi:MoxR-like ATPase